ncbi:interferon-stimulated 20 kDa exonuclease-like 2 [Sorex araneus]|uniref:interferon-stimulated 20 kDa exonuclease-like 2 n=1 Tax=Sorex araneus TaxID=42254 RepID=UPI0003314DAD|nr:interferon-stimulated 20 kDa exonuclease-like 2 [Sorex araneus]XP_054994148.1 interferon-stimulated 20 kDa exonuclease-like 2 [Sorex araneus]XP_054994149.1 interferon-stimulated 20 kDa exonuclease-like 2 [Sorex araneus]XP_054994151.1 interferon-stimulated 20 kDa exonuclease-like 2 [Sorex araneus]XP_054994152.1 interferon-stimulated 20 kDa exonuclease-like 2 [Sorex araneus]XP_054994153.1 interferon-stimulated 20 kDa exonuclease-like 2 [Sorex araneus]
MSTLLLNLDFGKPPPKKGFEGNAKHRSFVKKRRLLERKGLLAKKNQPPSKAPKARLEAKQQKQQKQQNGDMTRGDGSGKAASLPKKKPAASSGTAEPAQDRTAKVPWLTPGPSQKGGSVVAKVDLLGEFQSALPKVKSRVPRSQKGSRKKSSQKSTAQPSTQGPPESKCPATLQKIPSKMVAIDCEMVGTGPKGHVSSLARCSIVSYEGDVLYDEYIRPPCQIVDYRTRWSGIKRHHMVNATPFKVARGQILKLLTGKIVVGHAIHNDFKALQYFHPKSLTRDTSHIPLLNRKAGSPENATMSLKNLTKLLLNRDIQTGKSGHSSVEDAQATMELYKLVEVEWEQHLVQNPPKD